MISSLDDEVVLFAFKPDLWALITLSSRKHSSHAIKLEAMIIGDYRQSSISKSLYLRMSYRLHDYSHMIYPRENSNFPSD